MAENEQDTHNPGFTIRDRRGEEREDSVSKSEAKEASKTQNKSQEQAASHFSDRKKGRAQGPVDFSTFVFSLSSSAAVHMGLVADPVTKKTQKSLDLARQEIDILEMLKEKTQGNLSRQESQLLEEVLYELRVRFVELSRS